MKFQDYIKNKRSNIVLTDSQEKAVRTVNDFLSDPFGPQCLIIKGGAGSGKTFIGSLIKEFLPNNTHIFTPTGRAANVARSMVSPDKRDGNISTIHHGIFKPYSFTNHFIDGKEKPENLTSAKAKFVLKENVSPTDDLYICDESSMISDVSNFSSDLEFGSGDLLADLFTFVGQRKLIFIGDNGQLTPIKMYKSPALDRKYLQMKFGVEVMEAELTDIIRQKKGSGILSNASKVRENIFDNANHNTLDEFEDVKFGTEDDAILTCVKMFEPDSFSNFTVVTHTRKKSHKYNASIRAILFDNKSVITKGERLVCAQTNYKHDIWNGELMKVIRVHEDYDSSISKLIKLAPTERERRYYPDEIQEDGRIHVQLDYQKVDIEYHDASGHKEQSTVYLILNALRSDNLALSPIEKRAHLVEFFIRQDISKKQYAKELGKLKLTKVDVIDGIQSGKILSNKNDEIYNSLIAKYGYSITAHKAQGGEWEKAIVDFDTKFPDQTSTEYYRWLYTALTRAKNDLLIVNSNGYL